MQIDLNKYQDFVQAVTSKESNYPDELVDRIEELGDLEFYMEGLRQGFNISREETITANIEKLGIRYKNGYSDSAAQIRADKN